ncbi:MAG: radical SAM protein [Lysobacteraceae bacterium]|nr:MAG: radical SAM protein [Xanthomonadaceae bacterium]
MSVNAVVIKIASRCNLNCSYCYMYNHADQSYLRQPKIMSESVYTAAMETMLNHSKQQGTHHKFALIMHGGEPTLVGVRRFRWFVETARSILGERLMLVAIQTNALLLNPNWAQLFQELEVTVSVSLDGTAEQHDAFRVDHQGKGSHQRTVNGIDVLHEQGVQTRIICVANPAARGDLTYQHFRQLGITKMDFLFPDITHDTKQAWYGSYGETPVADFMIQAFDAWLDEDNRDVKVRIFYNLLRSFMGDSPGSEAFGNPLLNYLIVNTDGAIEGTDALRVCDEGLVDTGLNVLSNEFDQLAQGNSLLFQASEAGLPLCAKCQACSEVAICGGGQFPHRYRKGSGFDNPSAWCDDIKKLFHHVRNRTGLFDVRKSA